MNVVLMGLKHSGKSTLGRRLAEHLDCAFYDWDALVEAVHRERTGRSETVRELFAAHGPEYFAEMEYHAGLALQRQLAGGQRAVIALGGRTPLNERLAGVLDGLGLKVLLRVDPDVLYERIMAGGLPAFLDPEDPRGSWARRAALEPQYRARADATVELTGLDAGAAFDALLRTLEEHAHAR